MNLIKRIVTYKPGFTLRVFAGIVAVITVLSTCAITGISDLSHTLSSNDTKYAARAIEDGADVYTQQCARCHGADGKGIDGQGPELSGIYFLGQVDASGMEITRSQRLADIGWTGSLDDYIRAVTASGIPLKSSNAWDVVHPAFSESYGGNLRDDQIADVAKFIENWRQAPNTIGLVEEPKPGSAFGPQPTPVPLTPAEEAGKAIYLKEGCIACHTIRGVSTGSVGPNLSKIGSDAAAIIASPAYKQSQGKATTPEEYIRESIINPNAYISTNCPAGPCPTGIMPQNLGQLISPTDLNNLVTYLASLK